MSDATPKLPPRAKPAEIAPEDKAVTQSFMDDATYRDIAMALLQGERNMASIGRRYGLSRNQVRNLMLQPQFEVVYAEERERFYNNLGEHIANERNDMALRFHAAEARSLTALHEIQEHVRAELAKAKDDPDHYVGPGKLQTGVAAATAIMDRVPGGRHSKEVSKANTAANLQRAFTPTAAQARVISETLEESGVDLSDILDVTPPSDADEASDR